MSMIILRNILFIKVLFLTKSSSNSLSIRRSPDIFMNKVVINRKLLRVFIITLQHMSIICFLIFPRHRNGMSIVMREIKFLWKLNSIFCCKNFSRTCTPSLWMFSLFIERKQIRCEHHRTFTQRKNSWWRWCVGNIDDTDTQSSTA